MNDRRKFLPYGRQTIESDDIAAVAQALTADYLTTGPLVEKYESAFAKATGAKFAVACNSGTAALHLAALGLDLQAGQVAVIPAITFLATANVVRMTGAEVIFADVDPESGLMTPGTLKDAISRAKGSDVRAAFPVHLNGARCDMLGLSAAGGGIALVEDACHALGVKDAGAVSHSKMACFSTHPVKAIATGEGGVVTLKDEDLANRLRRLRSHGIVREPDQWTNTQLGFDDGQANRWYYEMPEIGWNYRLPDFMCALGLSQLQKLERFHSRREAIARIYEKELASLAPVIRSVSPSSASHGWHLYVVKVDFRALGTSRQRFMSALAERDVGSQVHYVPLHMQPYYVSRYGRQNLPNAEAYYDSCLSIPMYPSMTDDDARYVASVLANVAGR